MRKRSDIAIVTHQDSTLLDMLPDLTVETSQDGQVRRVWLGATELYLPEHGRFELQLALRNSVSRVTLDLLLRQVTVRVVDDGK